MEFKQTNFESSQRRLKRGFKDFKEGFKGF